MDQGISVILPVYNGEALLSACVESILGAGKRVREIIIVDDGSTDGTLAAAMALPDPRIRVIHTDNQGSYMARRTGITVSACPYTAFIDVDDRFVPGALDMLAELLEMHEADAAMGGIVETRDPRVKFVSSEADANIRALSQDEMWPRIMRWKTQEFILYVWHKLYKKNALENLVPAEGICQGDDVLITCQAFLRIHKTVETAAPVYLYYQNPDSLTHRGFGTHDLDLISVWDRIVEIMAAADRQDLLYMARINRYRTDFTLLMRLILANDKELERTFGGQEKSWREGLKLHYRDLMTAGSLPLSRTMLMTALRYAYGPTKLTLRLIGDRK